jgi:hypothetical protein
MMPPARHPCSEKARGPIADQFPTSTQVNTPPLSQATALPLSDSTRTSERLPTRGAARVPPNAFPPGLGLKVNALRVRAAPQEGGGREGEGRRTGRRREMGGEGAGIRGLWGLGWAEAAEVGTPGSSLFYLPAPPAFPNKLASLPGATIVPLANLWSAEARAGAQDALWSPINHHCSLAR